MGRPGHSPQYGRSASLEKARNGRLARLRRPSIAIRPVRLATRLPRSSDETAIREPFHDRSTIPAPPLASPRDAAKAPRSSDARFDSSGYQPHTPVEACLPVYPRVSASSARIAANARFAITSR